MNRKLLITLVIVLSGMVLFAQKSVCPIIPLPNNIEYKSGQLILSKKLRIDYGDKTLDSLVGRLKRSLNQYSETRFKFSEKKGTPVIKLEIDNKLNIGEEAYKLDVTSTDITIKASTKKGLYYGIQSVIQLVLFSANENGRIAIRCCSITDKPRYVWRGLMLDESRHFFGKEKVKQLIDYMALHKLNVFHWHLTDVAGWRIEIKKYPKLALVGGKGNDHDPNAEVKYYTQKEIAEIVKYAQDRFVEVIPEIDMPGHAAAANRAYPEYSGGGSEKHPDFTFNPGKEEVYQYLSDILEEVKTLFPSEYIHVGGDEVHFGNQQWKEDADVQNLMKVHDLKDLKEVEQYFLRRMADSIAYIGKKVIGWDEVIKSGLNNKTTVVMWWRHDKPHLLNDAIEKGFKVVMCPRIPLYFDFVQHDSHKYGRRWGGFCDIEKVYRFPGTDIDRDNKQIAGIQANVWTERIQNNERLDFMTFPRLSAMAEAAWSNDETKVYSAFVIRLTAMMRLFDMDGIYYFDPYNVEKHPEPKGIEK